MAEGTQRRAAILAAVAALAVAGCGTTASKPHVHVAAPATYPVVTTAPAPAPTAAAAPACDITAWEAASPGATTVLADMQAMGNDAGAGDTLGAAGEGHQLAQDAVAAQHPRPPKCAPRLRAAWKRMMLWCGIAGLAIYITGARPYLASHNYRIATRAINRANRNWAVVQAQESALGG